MITDKDIEKLKKIFVTKEDLSLGLTQSNAMIISQITDVVTNLGNSIQESIDRLHTHQHLLEVHDSKIKKLENKVFA